MPLYSSFGLLFLPTHETKPRNNAYPGYDEFSSFNLILAQELGKLPELKDGISPAEVSALAELLSLYKIDSHSSIALFNRCIRLVCLR